MDNKPRAVAEDLVTSYGTLRPDPRYRKIEHPNLDAFAVNLGDHFSGTSQRKKLAQWLASMGYAPEAITRYFVTESLGQKRPAIPVATIRRDGPATSEDSSK